MLECITSKYNKNAEYRLINGGCGLVHECPLISCKKMGCYEHLNMNDLDFDFSNLNYGVLCNCTYDMNNKIAVRSTFQGAIPCFLNSRNSNASLTVDSLNFMTDYYS